MVLDTEQAAHLYRSPLLGRARVVRIAAGEIRCFERGSGPAIVFVHGWLANANVWRKLVTLLSDSHRCIVLDMPLGAHGTPVDPDADLTPSGCGALIMDTIEALGLDEVTLVGSDSGGAYSQIGVAARPERIARLVLTTGETPYDVFPPAPFTPLREAAQSVDFLKARCKACAAASAGCGPRRSACWRSTRSRTKYSIPMRCRCWRTTPSCAILPKPCVRHQKPM